MTNKSRHIISLIIGASILLSACRAPAVAPPQTQLPVEPTPTMTAEAGTEQAGVEQVKYIPEARIKDGDEALLFGDYDKSERIFAGILEINNSPEMRAMALYGLGMTYVTSKKEPLALTIFEELVTTYPNTLQANRAYFQIGEIYTGLGRNDEALLSYQSYLQARPGVIDAFVLEKIGDIQVALKNYKDAVKTYEAAYLASDPGAEGELGLKIATTYDSLDEDDVALSLYQDIYYNTTSIYTKAQMDLLIGRIHYEEGDLDQAYAYFQDAVNNYPEAYDSFSALLTLVNDGIEVDEFQRGLINYNIGQYDLAIEAFDRYMVSPQANIPAGLYYKGLSIREGGLEEFGITSNERFEANKKEGTPADNDAIGLWNEILLEYPKSEYYDEATEEISYTYFAYMNNPKKAAEVSLDLVSAVPDSVFASSFLFSAGRYYEIAGMFKEAADTWIRLGTEYPSSSQTFQGLFFGGMLYYQLEDLEKAQAAFNRALVLSLDPLETSGAHLWRGIVAMKMGDDEAARDAWKAAAASDPNGYHGLRAVEFLEGVKPFTPPTTLNFDVNWDRESTIAKTWLRSSFMIPNTNDLNELSAIGYDQRFIKGTEFWKLGLYEQGRTQFESLRSSYQNDPAATYKLIQVFIDLGYYRLVIAASRNIVKLAGLDEFHENVPRYFKLLIYGAYYRDWVLAAAKHYSLDPLLLFSLIHQESHFEGYLSSPAGARGLMQIMPETGAQVANDMSWPENFETADLDIPDVGLTLGANYLRRQVIAFDGDIYAALAAYNGGPGNALKWKETAGDDPDLFLGSVRFLETRTYIRIINENYAQYRLLYGSD